jgi:hypothetical protein
MNKFSPKKYIISKGRNLPFYECFINSNWKMQCLATISISKKMPSGKFIIAVYMVDLLYLGVKNTFYNMNFDNIQYDEFIERLNENPEGQDVCDISHAHNIIYGAIDFAEEHGVKPHKDFAITEYLLDPDLITDEIDEIEFGRDGKPLYIQGPNDDIGNIF